MKIASKPESDRTEAEKTAFREYNKEAKQLESSTRLNVPMWFQEELKTALEQIGAYFPDRLSGGVVSRNSVKAEYKSDYIIAYCCICNHMSTMIYSSDSDMTALYGPSCISIHSFREESKQNKNTNGENEAPVFTYKISLGSNTIMHMIKEHFETNLPGSQIRYTPAKYPLLEEEAPSFLTALYVVGVGCDVLPHGVSGITPLAIMKEIKKIHEQEGVRQNDYTEQ